MNLRKSKVSACLARAPAGWGGWEGHELYRPAEDRGDEDARQASRHQREAEGTPPRSAAKRGRIAATRRSRLLSVPCGAG